MIDELVLEQLLAEIAEGIEVPAGGAERVVHELAATEPATGRISPRSTRVLMVAAALVVVVGMGVLVNSRSKGSSSRVAVAGDARQEQLNSSAAKSKGSTSYFSDAPVHQAPNVAAGPAGLPGLSPTGAVGVSPTGNQALVGSDGAQGAGAASASGPVDGAKIVKTGSLDLEIPHGSLAPEVNRVSGVAVGLGGYVANSRSSSRSDLATAQITIRVPVNNFDNAVKQVDGLPGVKVLGDSENGADVTGQFSDLQAQLAAATAERDALLQVLSQADNVPDILNVHDRIESVQAGMNQLQGRLNVLSNQSTLSSIAVTLTEKAVHKPHAAVKRPSSPPTGLDKAWIDARQGFSNSVEWLIARSGGALIVLLAALALLFGLRYLYPVVRRGLL